MAQKFGIGFTCPCCDNPWAQTGEDADYAVVCSPCKQDVVQKPGPKNGIQLQDFDETVNPGENFYYYAIGGWRKSNPIPPEYPSWNVFTSLHDTNQKRIRAIIDELEAKPEAELQGVERKVADYYASAMDEASIDAMGARVLDPIFEACARGRIQEDGLASVLAGLASTCGVESPFSVSESPDKDDPKWTILQLGQGGLGLPDRDYYFDEDKAEKREAYRKHIARVFGLLGHDDEAACSKIANSIYDLELKIAEGHMTKTERRDPHKTFNKMNATLLQEKCSSTSSCVNWTDYMTKIGKPDVGDFNVSNVEPVIKTCAVLEQASPGSLEMYLKWHITRQYSRMDLPKAFGDAHFDFYDATLTGQKERKPRWKEALASLESVLGEALGELYVARFFASDSKQLALEYVDRVRQVLEERLHEVEWMSARATRDEALKKMSCFKTKLGYPDKWVDYSTLTVERGNHFENRLEANRFDWKRMLAHASAKTDTSRWFMTPQTINAYYHPSLNEIVFPAAILQPPFFDPTADAAVNFGGMAAVIGHEMTHGFDDQGRKYDSEGKLRDWWTEADASEFEKRANVMVQQAEQFTIHGMAVKGKLTCGENIADLGGMRLAQRAFVKMMGEQGRDVDTEKINGLTLRQRFYLSWARVWAQNSSKDDDVRKITIDPHGPNEMRVTGTLKNIPEFASTFQIPEGARMFLKRDEMVEIW